MMLATDDAIPLMITLNRFADDDAVAVLMIDDVADTPLVALVITLPDDDNVFEEITLLVATTPLIVVVRVLPERF